MNELNFLGDALNKATEKGAFNLAETSNIARCLTVIKAKLEKFEQKQKEVVKENDFDGPTGG
jgi:hypothetical protein